MTKKELGQHWLYDETILQSIVSEAHISEYDTVLEIGPGKGSLTQKLADTGGKVIALEFDQDLIAGLKKQFSNYDNVSIIEGDIRTFDFEQLPAGYKIVANIPYYLTSHLIRNISEAASKPAVAALLVQKEVAERICAKPGQMSILSCVAQYWFDCELSVEVPAEYFSPPPKVDSQVVVMKRREKPVISTPFTVFTDVVLTAFSQKRKKISNSLQKTSSLSKEQVTTILTNANIDGNLRAQQLDFDQWQRLAEAYSSVKK